INGEAFRHEEGEHAAPHGRRYRLEPGRWVRLRFENVSYRLHPMHVHGQFFRVLTRNGSAVDEGHWRDTVLLGPRETVDVAMFPQDLGVWMLHCHIQEHAESGMMTLIDVPVGATVPADQGRHAAGTH
ncbi:multicopper oxidase domain-containing protein, partial [Pyxidicoccus fallax]|uniref:multicopper oxidase domain-containing protein n=1 Tax=Pyxidicoccus fallax TaxID=394095 RepID=UPI001494A296